MDQFKLAEENTTKLLQLVDQMAEEKHRFESTNTEEAGEIDLF